MGEANLASQNLALAQAAYASAMCNSSILATATRAVGDRESVDGEIDGVVNEFFAANFVLHEPPPGIMPNREGTKQWTAAIIKAAPDYYVHVDDQFAVDDKVVTRWTARGTHQGEFLGVPTTGKQVTVPGITISRYADGKIVATWVKWDTLDLMKQLGAYPSDGGWRGATGGITLNININRA